MNAAETLKVDRNETLTEEQTMKTRIMSINGKTSRVMIFDDETAEQAAAELARQEAKAQKAQLHRQAVQGCIRRATQAQG